MSTLLVVDQPSDWPLEVQGVELVSARRYLTDAQYSRLRSVKVFNLCRSYRYQSVGYYVSLLAEARGHKTLPSVSTIQDMKSPTMLRFVSDDLEELIQKSLAPIQSEEFTLSIYFGRNLAKRYDRLSSQLFNLFRAPLLRATFAKHRKWQLQNIRPIAASEIPPEHHPFVVQVAADFFDRPRFSSPRRVPPRYDLAILYNPQEEYPPSDEKAISRFVKEAQALNLGVELIGREDYGRIAEFDALFIRETTSVNHHTFRFARRAAAEGLVVVDDPDSILKCTNKVYLSELLQRHHLPSPKTRVLHKDNLAAVLADLGLPLILKQPDSSFSQGVVKVDQEENYREKALELLERSDLVIAQEFLPTDFDWRVGIFDGRPLYVCKYFMARKHWQIMKKDGGGGTRYGKVETLAVEDAPRAVVRTALSAARLVGDGLYGVDLKQVGRQLFVIEINDNPSIESGEEDAVLKDELYARIMRVFLERIERRKKGLPG